MAQDGQNLLISLGRRLGSRLGTQLAEEGLNSGPLGRADDDVAEALHGLQLVAFEVDHQLVSTHELRQQIHPHLDFFSCLYGVFAGRAERER